VALPVYEVNLLIMGAGARVAALAGAVDELEDMGYTFRRIGAMSAGTLVGAPLACGVSRQQRYVMAVEDSMGVLVDWRNPVQAIKKGGLLDYSKAAMYLDSNIALHGKGGKGSPTTFARLDPLDPAYAKHLKPSEATRFAVRMRQEAAAGMGLGGRALWGHEVRVVRDDMRTFSNEAGAFGLINEMPTVDLPWDLDAITVSGKPGATAARLDDVLVAYTSAASFAQPIANGPVTLDSSVLPGWDSTSVEPPPEPVSATQDRSKNYLERSGSANALSYSPVAMTSRRVYDGATGDRIPRDPFFRLADGTPDPTPVIVLSMYQALTFRGQIEESERDQRMYPDKLVIRLDPCRVQVAQFNIKRDQRERLWDVGKIATRHALGSIDAIRYLADRNKQAESLLNTCAQTVAL
jgi:hypothetical protein